MIKKRLTKYLWLAPIGLLVILVLYNNWQVGWLNVKVNQEKAKAKEAARPANLEATLLQSADCALCSSLDPYLDYLEKNGGQLNKINQVDVKSAEGQAMVQKYQINRAPVMIISGELDKKDALKKFFDANGEIIDNIFVFRNVFPPYYDLLNSSVKGLVNLTMIKDASCQECYDVTAHQKIIENFGVKLTDVKEVLSSSPAGQTLIQQYQLPYLPTIVLSPEIELYPQVRQLWPQLGQISADGSYVFTEGVKQMGVYHDLASGKVVKPVAAANQKPAASDQDEPINQP